MALIRSAASGNWNASATWVGGVIPVAGDQVQLATGHTVTVPAGYTAVCGLSAADATVSAAATNGTLAIDATNSGGSASTTSTGSLVVNGTLRYRGPIRLANGNLTVNAGGRLEHDSSAAAAPATTNYQLSLGRDNGQANATLYLVGAAGNRAVWTNAAGSGRAGPLVNDLMTLNGTYSPTSAGYSGVPKFDASYGQVTDIGPAALGALGLNMNNAAALNRALDTLFSGCAAITMVGNMNASATVEWRRSSYLNPAAKEAIISTVSNAPGAGVVRLFQDCIIEGTFASAFSKAWVLDRTAIASTAAGVPFEGIGGTIFEVHSLTDVLIFNRRTPSSADSSMPVSTQDPMALRVISLRVEGSGGDEDHFRLGATTAIPSRWLAPIFEYAGTSGDGDCLVFQGNPGSLTEHYALQALVLPNAAGNAAGTLVSIVTTATLTNFRMRIEHATQVGGSAVLLLEGPPAGTGFVPSLRSNLIARAAPGSGQLVNITGSETAMTDGAITAADHNGRWNVSADPYVPTDPRFGTPPGTGDVTTDPQFVDPTRDFLSWGQSINPALATWDDVWNEIRKKNDDVGYNAAFDWFAPNTGAYDWIRAGFAPQNPDYQGTAHDGSDIGAVPVASASGVTGTVDAPLQRVTAQATGAVRVAGAVAGTLQRPTLDAGGAVLVRGTVAGTLQRPTASATGAARVTGAVSAELQRLTSASAAVAPVTAATQGILQRLTLASTGTVSAGGARVNATLRRLTASATGVVSVRATAAPAVQRLVGAGSGQARVAGRAVATLPRLTSVGVGRVRVQGSATGVLQRLTLRARAGEGPAVITIFGGAQPIPLPVVVRLIDLTPRVRLERIPLPVAKATP